MLLKLGINPESSKPIQRNIKRLVGGGDYSRFGDKEKENKDENQIFSKEQRNTSLL